ncbi:hypothetical protein INR49_005163 [Caranx melampygus]|nr:hypothetical protein INR49_005163 [Caranx melampygus]
MKPYAHEDCRFFGLIANVDVRSQENNSAHRTKEIDQKRLIVRRGQPFSITLQCTNPLPAGHYLELVLHLGKKDEVVTKVQKQRDAGDKWWFDQQVVQDEILLTLHSPADAIIGQYHDVVYLADERLLQEYIMNEAHWEDRGEGKQGGSVCQTSKQIDGSRVGRQARRQGVFEDDVMDICFEILDNSKDALRNSKKDIEKRSDPVYVGRTITAMVNYDERDRGVLWGRWNEPYTDGVAPYRWTGSVPILQKWSKAGAKPVKYGQCWVFAGVACTVLRCLGIPTRHITNFDSAHDSDGNLSIDFLWNEKLESLDGSESSWNFHCWVESWMRRDDLPKGNDGWQVLDPTPQELSDGEYRCGPCPVIALKEGNMKMKYDAPFIFAEVNADMIFWIVKPDGTRQKIKVDQRTVGKNISTKSVYSNQREDVTLHYKYPEGSKKEREVYEKAGGRFSERVANGAALDAGITMRDGGITEPPQLQVSIKHAQPVFGTDFDVIVEVKNGGSKDTNARLTILAMAVTYNSIGLGTCKRQTTTHKEVMRLRYEDYAKSISEHHVIRAKALLEAPGLNEPIMTMVNIPLSTPQLLVQVPGKATVGEQITVYVSFINPLPVPLKGGVFTVEGAGLLPATEISCRNMADFPSKVTTETSSANAQSSQQGGNSLRGLAANVTVMMDMSFIRSIPAYLMIAEIVLGLLHWALIAGAPYWWQPAYGWVLFVAITLWLLTTVLFFMILFSVQRKLHSIPGL